MQVPTFRSTRKIFPAQLIAHSPLLSRLYQELLRIYRMILLPYQTAAVDQSRGGMTPDLVIPGGIFIDKSKRWCRACLHAHRFAAAQIAFGHNA